MPKLLVFFLLASASFSQVMQQAIVNSSPQAGAVAVPVDSPGAGTYSTTQSVTLTDSTPSAVICYRTDGVAPTAATAGTCDAPATTYSGAFNISATTTLKAIGTKVGKTNSGVLTSVYTIVSDTAFVTGQTLSSPRGGALCVGHTFTVGASSITVDQLGRWTISGNSATHVLWIGTINLSNGIGTPLASVTVNTSGATAGQYLYGSITPTVLSGSTSYFVCSQESASGDQFYDLMTFTHTSAASVPGYLYFNGTLTNSTQAFNTGSTPDYEYGAFSFQYH